MALMTDAQTKAELARKASLGIKPTNAANNAAYEKLIPQKSAAPTQIVNKTPTDGSYGMTSIGGAGAAGLSSSGGGWTAALDALKYSQAATPGAAIGAGVGVPTTPYIPPADISSNSNVGTAPPTDNGLGNAQDYINKLNDMRKNAALSALGKSHDAALSNLGSEKLAIQPKYYDARNATSAGAQQQARNFAEYMAARGGTNSGANAQATLSSNMNTQSNLGTLGRQETAAYTDIERRTSDLNNAYQSDIATTTANAEADKMAALLQDYYTAQQRGDTQAQNAIQNAMSEAQLTGQYKNSQTLAAQSQNFNQNLSLVQQQQNEANTKFAQQMQIDGVAYQQARDAITDKNYQKEFENNIKQQGFENALKTALQAHQISNDAAQLAISRQNSINSNANQQADNALQRDKFNYDTDKNNIDNLYKQSQIDKNKADSQKAGLDDAYLKAVGLAQKDPLFATYDATKQSQIINTHYDNLKPKSAVTDGDISQYLNKK